MLHRKPVHEKRDTKNLLRGGVTVLLLIALAIGGTKRSTGIFVFFLVIAIAIIAIVVVAELSIRWLRNRHASTPRHQRNTIRGPLVRPSRPIPVIWSPETIRKKMGEIDWYQFEKFCAALLEADGFIVERRGGAHPDGGVDLIAEKGSAKILVQCKHWKSWDVKERTVRELMGSIVDFGVEQAALYTLGKWTAPAALLASKHSIRLVDGNELAARAATLLSPEQLDRLLDSTVHHCPKCEGPMIWRQGDFEPFWSCKNFPRCRGKLNQPAAK